MKNYTLISIQYYSFLLLSIFLVVSCNNKKATQEMSDMNPQELAMLSMETSYADYPIINPTQQNKDTRVVVSVDTENITEENMYDYILFSDDRSDSSEKPINHVAVVDKNMKIYWSGEAMDPESGVTVDIIEVYRKQEGGAVILDKVFRDTNQDGVVVGKIKNKKVQGFENYNIIIRVNTESPQTFVIDPKIKMSGT